MWDDNKSIKLSKIDAAQHGNISEEEARKRVPRYANELYVLQELMYGSAMSSVLIVLQGMDTSGKDGTISHVMSHINPQGCSVAPFKVPTPIESAHDFLWRAHQETPARGKIAIFNRSYYEDVLVVRVHQLQPKAVWKGRYEHIVNFEKLLFDNGTIILKFFLHISKDEQEERLLAREQDPTKAWKLAVGDWKEREYWDDYQSAYEDAIAKTSTKEAPWHIVPANHKWYRNVVISEAIVKALKPHRKSWETDLQQEGEKAKAAIAAMHLAAGTGESTDPAAPVKAGKKK